jgi:hypothetical protein
MPKQNKFLWAAFFRFPGLDFSVDKHAYFVYEYYVYEIVYEEPSHAQEDHPGYRNLGDHAVSP